MFIWTGKRAESEAPSAAASSRSAFAVTAFVFVLCLFRSAWIAVSGEDRIVANVPDDGFYYFVLGRQFAETGHWTFDGVAPATGFHLLWGYIMAGAYALHDSWPIEAMFLGSSLIGAVCFAVGAWALTRIVQPLYGAVATLAVATVFVGSCLFIVPTMAMEAPLVIMFAGLCAWLCLRPAGAGVAPAFAVGLLGELSRSDFGLVPLSLLVALAAGAWITRASGTAADRRVQAAASALTGSVLGLLVTLVHSYAVSGQLLQNSAAMKAYWSGLAGHPIAPVLQLLGQMYGYSLLGTGLGWLLFLWLGLAASLGTWLLKRGFVEYGVSVLITVGYILVYRHNSQALQYWYLASLVIPGVVFLAAALSLLARVLPLPIIAAVLGVAMLGNIVSSLRPVWPHQVLMAEAGKTLRDRQLLAGAWNAGIIGYFNYGRTVNLDGLVNDDILPFAKQGTLLDYIKARKIEAVADFATMLDENYSRRGGYADGRLTTCLRPVQELSRTADGEWGTPLRISLVTC